MKPTTETRKYIKFSFQTVKKGIIRSFGLKFHFTNFEPISTYESRISNRKNKRKTKEKK